MTPQQVFDKMVKHLYTQNARCVDGDACRYRGPKGMKCAVGALITDRDYREGMDTAMADSSISNVITKYPHLPKYITHNAPMLAAMQTVHDEHYVADGDWYKGIEANIKKVAEDYNLIYNNPAT